MASEKENQYKRFQNRATLRQEAKALLNQAMNDGNLDIAQRYLNFIEDDMAYSYQELPFDSEYTDLLKEHYASEENKPYEGDIRKLINKDFGNWNFVESNLTFGAGKELIENYTTKTDVEKKNALRRYEIFSGVSPWGDDSRDFINFTGKDVWDFFTPSKWTGQAPDVIQGIVSDPVTYITGGLSALLSKSLVKKGLSTSVAPRVATSVGSSVYAGVSDVERQALGQSMGSEKPYSLEQTLTSMGIGAVAPRVLEPVGTAVGKTARAITHPFQSLGTIAKFLAGTKGKEAASKGVAQNVAGKLAVHGDDFSIKAGDLKNTLKENFNRIDNYFRKEYDKLKTAPIKVQSVIGVIERWRVEGFPISKSLARTIEKLESGKMLPEVAARNFRKSIAVVRGQVGKDVSFDDQAILKEYYSTLTNIIKKGTLKVSPEGTAKLDAQYAKIKSISNSKYGKLLLAASEDSEAAGKLVKAMLKPDFNWNVWKTTVGHLKKMDDVFGDNVVSNSIIKKIQGAISPALIANNGKSMATMIKTKSGLKTLKNIFPELSKSWDNIAEISHKLGNFEASSSVIANMSVARLSAMPGQALAGDIGGLVAAPSGLMGLNKLMDSKFFRSAMVHAYKREGGRLTTSTRNWMTKQGLSIKEINVIQDTMWGLTASGFALKGEAMLSDTGDLVYDKFQDIKAGFTF